MPPAPVPADVDEFLRRPNPAVVASLRRDGSPHTVATWYDWNDNRVLLNMDESRLRLRFMRRDPRVALTVRDNEGRHRHISLLDRIVSLEHELELRDIDRLALRYTGEPFRTRDRRRSSAWIEVEAWHGGTARNPGKRAQRLLQPANNTPLGERENRAERPRLLARVESGADNHGSGGGDAVGNSQSSPAPR